MIFSYSTYDFSVFFDMTNAFWLHPGHFGYYVRRLLILFKSSLLAASHPAATGSELSGAWLPTSLFLPLLPHQDQSKPNMLSKPVTPYALLLGNSSSASLCQSPRRAYLKPFLVFSTVKLSHSPVCLSVLPKHKRWCWLPWYSKLWISSLCLFSFGWSSFICTPVNEMVHGRLSWGRYGWTNTILSNWPV